VLSAVPCSKARGPEWLADIWSGLDHVREMVHLLEAHTGLNVIHELLIQGPPSQKHIDLVMSWLKK